MPRMAVGLGIPLKLLVGVISEGCLIKFLKGKLIRTDNDLPENLIADYTESPGEYLFASFLTNKEIRESDYKEGVQILNYRVDAFARLYQK